MRLDGCSKDSLNQQQVTLSSWQYVDNLDRIHRHDCIRSGRLVGHSNIILAFGSLRKVQTRTDRNLACECNTLVKFRIAMELNWDIFYDPMTVAHTGLDYFPIHEKEAEKSMMCCPGCENILQSSQQSTLKGRQIVKQLNYL